MEAENREQFEAVVRDFRAYVTEMHEGYFLRAAAVIAEGHRKEKEFRDYVQKCANWGDGREGAPEGHSMRAISQRLSSGSFGQSSVTVDYHGNPETLFFGYRLYLEKAYSFFFKTMHRYLEGKKAVEGETIEQTYHRAAQDLANEEVDGFLEDVSAKAGEILGAKALTIECGNINGIVVGTLADVKVTTFGAGGWNIQRFHFRTKVTALKERA